MTMNKYLLLSHKIDNLKIFPAKKIEKQINRLFHKIFPNFAHRRIILNLFWGDQWVNHCIR